MGADIVNCSFGSNERNTALEYAISNTAMIFVCAAGNNAANIDDTPFYPASYDCENIISVAAMDGNNLAFFSNYGKDIDIAVNGASAKSSTCLLYTSYAILDIKNNTFIEHKDIKSFDYSAQKILTDTDAMVNLTKKHSQELKNILKFLPQKWRKW